MDIVEVDKINAWAIESGDFIRLPNGSEVVVKRVESSALDNHYSVIYLNDFGDDEESFTLDQDEMVSLLQYA
jgi:putative aminopeptidase FrvX